MSESTSSSAPRKSRKYGAGIVLICATIFLYRLIVAHTVLAAMLDAPNVSDEQLAIKVILLFLCALFPIVIAVILTGTDALGVGAGMFLLLAVYDFLLGYLFSIEKQALVLVDVHHLHRVVLSVMLCSAVLMMLFYAVLSALRKSSPTS